MSRLVDDLLTLARLDGGLSLQCCPLPLGNLLDAAVTEARILGRGAQEVVLDPLDGNVIVWGDRDRLRQVFSNVIGNACVYGPPGTRIVLHAARSGRWITITVADNGPGIPPADLARLGERFFRGDAARSRRTGGTGLGLAIASGIVAAHGGTFHIDSVLGHGTTVTVRLPAVTQPARPPSATLSFP